MNELPINSGGETARAVQAANAVNPEMLVLARESRGLSQSELAEILSVSQGKISKLESGSSPITGSDLDRISKVLDYPTAFFFQEDKIYGFGTACMYHRKRQSMPIKELQVIHAKINVLRLQIGRLLKAVDVQSANSFHRMDIDEYETPERVAQLTRAAWGIPLGPIRNLVGVIENAGGVAVPCEFGTDKIDAVSQWPRNSAPLLFVNSKSPTDRMRFSLAHELGHLIMHAIPTPDAETEADRFAGEFLMPAREIAGDLAEMTLAKAARLKLTWRASMQAIIRRAKHLGKITENQYRFLCTKINKEGMRKEEPVELDPESPTVIQDLLMVYRKNFGYDVPQLSEYVFSNEDQFRELLLRETGPRLRIVG